jgi:hypothetical protein
MTSSGQRFKMSITFHLRKFLLCDFYNSITKVVVFESRIFEAGHEIPAFKPGVALEIFSQVIRNEQLHSV